MLFMSEMEVVVERVSENQEEGNDVNQRLRAVLVEKFGLVLDLRSQRTVVGSSVSSRKSLVKVNDSAHSLGIRSRAQVLERVRISIFLAIVGCVN